MKQMLKVGVLALAIAATSSSFAQFQEESEGAVGWTPVAIGLATPVQLPWGLNQWDVFGLDIGLLYADTPLMYGLGVGGLGFLTRDDMAGLTVGGLFNYAVANTYGMRATLGANISRGESYGLDVGLVGYHESEFWGLDVEGLGAYQSEIHGMQVCGLGSYSDVQSYGWVTSIGFNGAKTAYGFQLAGLFNYTEELHGCQLAIVNFAERCPWGFQIGLVNIILDNKVKVLPIVNGYF